MKGEHTFKILVTGDYKAGKTSLINRFVEEWFHEGYTSTVGIDISNKVFNLGKKKVRFSIWESGGLISQIPPNKEKFYNHANAAIIVIDRTQPNFLISIDRWYKEIVQSTSAEIPITIVINKSDLLNEFCDNEEIIKEVSNKYGIYYIFVSSKTGENVNEVFFGLGYKLIDSIKNQKSCETNEKYEKFYLNLEEAKALEDLERLIIENSIGNFVGNSQNINLEFEKKGFLNKFEIDETTLGVKIQKGHIVGLGLFNCGLTTLPESFNSFKFLKKLILRCNPLNKLPESIIKLMILEELDLSLTNLKILPKSIGNLKRLKKLLLENNWLKTLPESIGNLTSLKILNLENNPLNALPKSFVNLISLKKLFLETAPFEPKGYLIKLPKFFGNLKSLQELDLSSHKLRILPESFGSLKSLKILDLYNNSFTTLPRFFGNLKSLENLNLENNIIRFLPDSLSNLKKIREINLKNNLLAKNGADHFRALAFKSSGIEYDRLMKIAENIEKEGDKQNIIKKKFSIKNILASIAYAASIAFIGVITFLSINFESETPNLIILWLLFFSALLINLIIGASIISTISSYFKISVEIFAKGIQRHIYKLFDVFVAFLLVWAIRSSIKKGLSIELIPPINFLFEFTIPEWILNILILFGYDIELTFLENLDLFLGHFYLKLFSTALVFWALFRNGFGYIKKTAFDEKQNKTIWQFLVLGLFGAFALAVMYYSSLKPFLSIGYSIGVIIGGCIFMWEKNKNNKIVFYTYITLIFSGILIVWLLSLWNLLLSLIICIIFILIYFIIRWQAGKKIWEM
ncbi:MAG: GTP-binding protein [Promethearchaeota archaeon]